MMKNIPLLNSIVKKDTSLSYIENGNFEFLNIFTIFLFLFFNSNFCEASSLDQIKMTKFWLEHDRKNFTPMNLNIGT